MPALPGGINTEAPIVVDPPLQMVASCVGLRIAGYGVSIDMVSVLTGQSPSSNRTTITSPPQKKPSGLEIDPLESLVESVQV